MYAAVGIAWRRGARTTGWWLAAVLAGALLALDLAGQVHRGVADWKTLYFLAAMTVAMLVGSGRGPGGRRGWEADVLVARPRARGRSAERLPGLIARRRRSALGTLVFGYIVFAQMALSYPPAGCCRDAWRGSTSSSSATSRRRSRTSEHALLRRARLPVLPASARPDADPRRAAAVLARDWNNALVVFVMAILPIGLYLLYRAYAQASRAHGVRSDRSSSRRTFITCTSWISATRC